MPDKEFAPGDTVILKSGGPLMTIESIEGTEANTIWFERNAKKEGRFPLITLVHDDGVLSLG